jgi:hypothetical protein
VFIFYLFKLFIIPKEGQPITAVWRNSRHAASQPFGYCRLSAKRSIPLLIIYPLHNRLVFGSSFKPFYLGSDVVTVHFGYAYANGFGFKFAPLVSVGVWSYHRMLIVTEFNVVLNDNDALPTLIIIEP